ncbi:MAG: hypothetical protein ABII27_01575 [bacterium]
MKLFFKKISIFLPLPIIIIAVNYFVDPAHLFQNGNYEKGIAELLLGNKYVANTSNCDERLLQKYYIRGLKNKKDVIVLGSSTARMLGKDIFPGLLFFNSSVGGATIEDSLAIYWLYRKNNLLPRMIIFTADSCLFNVNNRKENYKSIEFEFNEALKYINVKNKSKTGWDISSIFNKKYLELISISYFKESLSVLLKIIKSGSGWHYYPITYTEEQFLRMPDGTFNIDANMEKTTAQIRKIAVDFAKTNPVYGLREYAKLDENKVEIFEKLIKLMLKDKVKPILFIPPYHPAVYDLLMTQNQYNIIRKVESYFIKFALNNKIKLLGSYNPSKLKLNETDFSDGIHLKKKSANIYMTSSLK